MIQDDVLKSKKVIFNKYIPFKGYLAMAIYPWIFVREEYRESLNARCVKHELIHHAQQKELLIIFFYILYFLEYLVRLIFCGFNHGKAYRSISFEQEAYNHEKELEYWKVRKPFGMWRKSKK